jgi:hypothetical protein
MPSRELSSCAVCSRHRLHGLWPSGHPRRLWGRRRRRRKLRGCVAARTYHVRIKPAQPRARMRRVDPCMPGAARAVRMMGFPVPCARARWRRRRRVQRRRRRRRRAGGAAVRQRRQRRRHARACQRHGHSGDDPLPRPLQHRVRAALRLLSSGLRFGREQHVATSTTFSPKTWPAPAAGKRRLRRPCAT